MLLHTVVLLTRRSMAKAQSKEKQDFQNANQELIDRAMRVQHTMATPGWADIMMVVTSEMEKIAETIDVCPLDQIDSFRKSRIALRLVLSGIKAIVEEGKNAEMNNQHQPDTY